MRFRPQWLRPALLVLGLAIVPPSSATDRDGPNDCLRTTNDFGDAPEGVFAYPGVPGRFPTCLAMGPAGTRETNCAPISSAPGPTGYVINANAAQGYWLGCIAGIPPQGVDSEPDAKTNSSGAATSACAAGITVDCFESAFTLSFGQDECYGDSDAGIAAPVTFTACLPATVTFRVFNCSASARRVRLNILVDWNGDGDWNDNIRCGSSGLCAYEWAVKNQDLTLGSACQTYTSPSFVAGPNPGRAWLRITLSDEPVADDFPWNGSVSAAGAVLSGGETEDYPVQIKPCYPDYSDFGDAPEGIQAYPTGVIGRFPTCIAPGPAGTQEVDCPPPGTPPGATTGFVEHVAAASDPYHFWLGCGPDSDGVGGVDAEADGKVNLSPPGGGSACNSVVTPDCVEAALALTLGQDECYGDGDAAIAAPVVLQTCSGQQQGFWYYTYSCAPDTFTAYVNVLIDWNMDGDWNDTVPCAAQGCVEEWLVKNATVIVHPGCSGHGWVIFTGPKAGVAWMRLAISLDPMPDDYPWNGTRSLPGQAAHGGEVEDYPVLICNPCDAGYVDFGDAPEEVLAYPGGPFAHYPTCVFTTGPGTQEIECGSALSSPPGLTGYVKHVDDPSDTLHFWLGCGAPEAPCLGHDDEPNGKFNLSGGPLSVCESGLLVDCHEPAFGTSYGQDECYGDLDAGVAAPPRFAACSTAAVRFEAYNCRTDRVSIYLNVLVDWSRDGDWNDNVQCAPAGDCAPEWAVKNRLVELPPGCSDQMTPQFLVGAREGASWMRMSLTADPVPDAYPWDGSAGVVGGAFRGGETEDYPVAIEPQVVSVGTRQAPNELWLSEARPDPAHHRAEVRFHLPRALTVKLAAFDVAGRKVRMLAEGLHEAGPHVVVWDFRDDNGREVPAGLYLLKLEAGGRTITQRVSRLR